jgi:hypothetical protein
MNCNKDLALTRRLYVKLWSVSIPAADHIEKRITMISFFLFYLNAFSPWRAATLGQVADVVPPVYRTMFTTVQQAASLLTPNRSTKETQGHPDMNLIYIQTW